MVERTIDLEGVALLDKQLENYNFTANNADNLVYTPSENGEYTEGLAQIMIDAEGGTAPLWRYVSYYLNRQDVTSEDNPYVPFEFYTELWGITSTGNLGFIGEDIVTTCPTSLTSERREFDLLGSACHSKFNISTATGTTGKITLNLPFRTDHYEELNLEMGTYSGWKRYKNVPITGNSGTSNDIPILIAVPYTSNMNSDFSDIRFIDWNGDILDYGIVSKTDSSTATFAVKLLNTPNSGVVDYISIWYKKVDATSQATDISNLYRYYDTFEDNLLTGRTSPLTDLAQWYGTLSITNTNPTSGSYSLKHIGDGTNYHAGWIYSNKTLGNSFSLEFNVKLITQGTGANTPYVSILYIQYNNYQNWLRIATWYDGTNQVIGLQQNVAGTITTLGSQIMIAGAKWGAPNTKTFRIIRSDSNHWGIQVDGGTVLYVTGNPGFTEIWGGAAQMDSQALWDDIKVYPYIGTVPTVGTVGSERQGEYGGEWSYTATAPDTLVPGTQQATFTTPTFPDTNPLSHITYQTEGMGELDSNSFRLTDGMILNQGYNSLDIYKSLILRFYAKTNSNYNISIDDVKAQYEI